MVGNRKRYSVADELAVFKIGLYSVGVTSVVQASRVRV